MSSAMNNNLTSKRDLAIDLSNRATILVVVESFFMVLINVISAVGNITLCYVIYKTPSLQTRTNMYIITLAVSDTLMAMLVMPLTVGVLIQGKWIFGSQVCQIQGFVSLSLGMISLQTMALIAINRYFCVVRPSLYPKLFGKKPSLAMMVGIWVTAVITAMAPLVLQIGEYRFMAGRASCFIVLPEFLANIVYTCVCLFFFVLSPFCVMICCYALVFRKIRQHTITNNLHAAADGRAEEIKTTRLLFVLVVGFSACWIPCIVIEITDSFLPPTRTLYMTYMYLAYLSSAINPVLYGIVKRSFRKAAMERFQRHRRSNIVQVVPSSLETKTNFSTFITCRMLQIVHSKRRILIQVNCDLSQNYGTKTSVVACERTCLAGCEIKEAKSLVLP